METGILHKVTRGSFITKQKDVTVEETVIETVPVAAKSAEERIAELEAKIEALINLQA